MALDVVREWVAAHGQDLWEPGRHAQPTTGWIGRRLDLATDDDQPGRPTVALLPQRLAGALQRAGYSLDAVLPGWQELGYLHKGSGRSPYQHVRAIGEAAPGQLTTKVRMYIFTPGTILADLTSEEHTP
jgi:hypothetical protein